MNPGYPVLFATVLVAVAIEVAPAQHVLPAVASSTAHRSAGAAIATVGTAPGRLAAAAGLRVEGVPLELALEALHRSSDLPLIFSPSLLPDRTVTCLCETASVADALSELLRGTGLGYVELGSQVAIVEVAPVVARAPLRVATVSGQVLDAQTLAPLPSVQVFISNLNEGTLTNAAGRFLLAGLPAGTHELRAERIGYDPMVQTVTLADGAAASVEIRLSAQALALDEVIVTGTAGQARRREVGNSITQLRPTDIVEAPQSVESILQGRGLGMTVMETSGAAGAGAQIRLRGNVSYSLSNQPLIYVDGVRVQSEGFHRAANTGSNRSPLADINPNDIERIEIVKGAAATTLYGSEAASGVIQIFTKRGASGAPTWTAHLEQGYAEVRPFGAGDNPYMFMEPWLRRGHRQRYGLDVRGGGEDLRYYVSGVFEDNLGPIQNNSQEKLSVRGNFDFNVAPWARLDLTTSVTHDDLEQLSQGGTGDASFILNVIRGEQGYMATRDFDELSLMLAQRNPQSTDRFISGATLTLNPTESFTSQIVVGHDLAEADNRQATPYGYLNRATSLGWLRSVRWQERNLTMDYRGSFAFPVSAVTSTLSWGAQMIRRQTVVVEARGNDLPGPGEFTVSSAAQRIATEGRTRYMTGGLFGQLQLGGADRYFLTLGARLDGNSAFGESLGVEFYPKASASYVISEEPFWPAALGDVKLRLAYGHAGRAPGAFDAVRTWSTPGWGSLPALAVGNIGNPDLGPERTAELEAGMDAAFFANRLQMEFTYYTQTTTDALLPVGRAPSQGGDSRLQNVGSLRNRGVEVALTGRPIDRPSWGLTTGVRLSTNYSKMLDMQGVPPFTLPSLGAPLATAWIMEGQPVPVMMAWKLLNPNEVADPAWDQEHVFGPNHPTHIVGGDLTLRLPGEVTLSATGEYQGGHYVEALLVGRALTRSVRPWPYCVDAYDKAPEERFAWERAECFGAPSFHMFTWPADFFKLREVSARVPVGFLMPGDTDASVTLSARNFWTWKNKDWKVYDPDMTGSRGMDSEYRVIDEVLPPAAVFTAALRVTF